jgi:hypothetical protein
MGARTQNSLILVWFSVVWKHMLVFETNVHKGSFFRTNIVYVYMVLYIASEANVPDVMSRREILPPYV